VRRLTITIGVALVLLGVRELIESTTWASLRGTITWFLGGVLIHDGVVVPLTLLLSLALTRLVPGGYRGLVQGALVIAAALTLALLPLLSGQGRTAANPSQQPLPYGRDLVVVLAAVWTGAAVLAFRRYRERHRDEQAHDEGRPTSA
jgi:hypothetical protein